MICIAELYYRTARLRGGSYFVSVKYCSIA